MPAEHVHATVAFRLRSRYIDSSRQSLVHRPEDGESCGCQLACCVFSLPGAVCRGLPKRPPVSTTKPWPPGPMIRCLPIWVRGRPAATGRASSGRWARASPAKRASSRPGLLVGRGSSGRSPIGAGYANPCISRGRLFLFDRLRNRARLHCWKAETAEPIWTFEYPTDYKDHVQLQRRAALLPGRGRQSRLYLWPRGDAALHPRRRRQAGVEDRRQGDVRRPSEFLRRRQHARRRGRFAARAGRRQPQGQRSDPHFEDLKGNGTGLVAFDKYTGKVKYKVSDELASYSSPVLATIGKRRWCFCSPAADWWGSNPARARSISTSLAGQRPGERQRQQPSRGAATGC